MKELLGAGRSTVRFAFRHFPLTDVHPYAELAAEAAEAAAARGGSGRCTTGSSNTSGVRPELCSGAVERLGLPPEDLTGEVGEHLFLDRIRRDFVGGIRSGVNGTPTFYVNEARRDGGYALEESLEAVDEAAEAMV